MNIILYGLHKTRAMRPRWLLEELQLQYQWVDIDIFQGQGMTREYRKIHPFGQVPAIDVDGKIIFESGAICHWLADQFLERGLAPAPDDANRSDYEQWMFFAASTLEAPAFNCMLHSLLLPEQERVAEVAQWNKQRYISLLKVLNRLLRGKKYLLGEQFSAADIMLAYILFWYPELVEPLPVLQQYCQNLASRKAYQTIQG